MSRPQQENFLAWCAARDPHRIRRFRKDVLWLRKQAIKAGLDPEEVKFLI